MWEIDPETKSKLLVLQKSPPNTVCVDCNSPSPQWASPKFGTFICLECAGIHRGMGVHISFVRSVMMDSFKVSEVRRMEEGGNKAWREFWEGHEEGGRAAQGSGSVWEGVVRERYDGVVGEEWKERLAARVEGRAFVPLPKVSRVKEVAAAAPSRSEGSDGGSVVGRKERNEGFFAKMGSENAARSEDLPPSQGGKYSGFGSNVTQPQQQQQQQQQQDQEVNMQQKKEGGGSTAGGGVVDEFQKDPVAALTKGFGWFTSAVGKQAKSVNDGWLQPNMQKLAESDFASQARQTANLVATNVSKGAQGAASTVGQGINRFVEGNDDAGSGGNRIHTAAAGQTKQAVVQPERKDFWDSFGGTTTDNFVGGGGGMKKSTTAAASTATVGTAAMKSGSGMNGGGGGGNGSSGTMEHRGEEWGKDDW